MVNIPNIWFLSYMFCFLSVLPLPYSNPHFCGKVPPQIRPFDFGDEASNSGETMGIQCTVIKGDLPINITWVLNNHTLNSGDLDVVIGRMSSKSSTLNIDYIAAEHRGFYTCLARVIPRELLKSVSFLRLSFGFETFPLSPFTTSIAAQFHLQ